jgi:hypothetical protein
VRPALAELVLTFDQTVEPRAARLIRLLRRGDDALVAAVPAQSSLVSRRSNGGTNNELVVALPLARPLDAGTTYYVNVDAGAVGAPAGPDFSGISGDGSWSFAVAGAWRASGRAASVPGPRRVRLARLAARHIVSRLT